ncbi:membrane fusion protein (multidrug efflux system) [Larkinella arboricola]|uniref:Membrane fusion protein (Multidrug efflux system) n=1 Tax=Larkinella arboricola TaxID=643671 RepID=A0A327WUP6_LARAB|nr:efflux RND transporter periplasmic adaptor subunit [Larkinella arboricola]RAJ92626.1 membrane fusion protein (multidrug efflux system) [Larkinella arboricola]
MKNCLSTLSIPLVTLLILTSCGGDNKQAQQGPPPAPAVSVVEATTGSAVYYDEYPATVTPLNEVQIFPQVSGYISDIFFQEGQVVSKGQKLYEIDKQQYQAAYDEAVANVNVAEANLNRAQKDADRYETLAKQDAIARQVVDNAEAALQSAKMQLAAAKANVSRVATSLNYATIKAPLTGTIGISQVKLGAAVSPGQTLLNTISAEDPIAVDIAVDETDIPRFVRFQNRKHNDSTFVFVLPDGTAYKASGRIAIIDRAVDPQTGTLKIRLVFNNKQKMLKSGMNGNVRVLNSESGQRLLIPYKAVTEQMSEYFVYVLGDSSKVSQRKVQLGNRIGANVIVKEGVREGDKIVTEGIQKLREGAVVKVADGAGAPQSTSSAAAPSATGQTR